MSVLSVRPTPNDVVRSGPAGPGAFLAGEDEGGAGAFWMEVSTIWSVPIYHEDVPGSVST